MTPPRVPDLEAMTPRCEAYTFDGVDSKPCTRPASVDRDGHKACVQHGRMARVRWTVLDFRGAAGSSYRPWWEG